MLRVLTTPVHCGTQYPVKVNSFCPGGIAILSVYSNPSSIIAASYLRFLGVTKSVTPELSIQSEKYSM